MKHTDFYSKYKELDTLEREELKAAVMAHGGVYEFDEDDSIPCIIGSFKHLETGHYIVTKVEVEEGGWLNIYGRPEDFWEEGEDLITYIEFGHIGFITDFIPETDNVKDVSAPSQPYKTYTVFGTSLVDEVLDMETEDDEELEELSKSIVDGGFGACDGVFVERAWNTEAEALAYAQGLEDMYGWDACHAIDPSETKLIEILRKHEG